MPETALLALEKFSLTVSQQGDGVWLSDLPIAALVSAVTKLRAAGAVFSGLTAVVVDGEPILWLHFRDGKDLLTLVTKPGAEPAPSIVELYPEARWAEREAADLSGVAFAAHDNPGTPLLPRGYDGPPPVQDAQDRLLQQRSSAPNPSPPAE